MGRRIRVMLEYFYPWTNSAGIFQARKAGYYAASGLDVEVAIFDPWRGDTLAYLDAGDADFGVFPTNRLLVLNESSDHVIGVAAVNQRGMETIQTVRGKGINSPADLAGARIALNPSPRGLAMVSHLVAVNGEDPGDWTPVDSGHGEVPAIAIREGDFDATFGTYWAWDIIIDQSLPLSERIYWPVDEIGAPRYLSYLLGTRRQLVTEEPALVGAFVSATRQGYLDVAADPAAARCLYADATPYLPAPVIAESLPKVATSWTHEGRWGNQREEYMTEYGRWLFDHRILRQADSWQTAYTNRFVAL